MPILGVIASSNYQRVTDTGAMFPLGMVQVGSGGVANIEFTSIPATYKHLQIRGIVKSGRVADNANIYMGFNNDTTTGNYYGHYLGGDGSTTFAGGKVGSSTNNVIWATGTNSSSLILTSFVIDILDYASTSKNKTTRVLQGYDQNGDGRITLISGLWMNSSTAISSIQFTEATSASPAFSQYSQFALYGIKGA